MNYYQELILEIERQGQSMREVGPEQYDETDRFSAMIRIISEDSFNEVFSKTLEDCPINEMVSSFDFLEGFLKYLANNFNNSQLSFNIKDREIKDYIFENDEIKEVSTTLHECLRNQFIASIDLCDYSNCSSWIDSIISKIIRKRKRLLEEAKD